MASTAYVKRRKYLLNNLAILLGILWGFNSTGVWMAISVTNIISGLWSYLLFKRGKWKEVSIHRVS